MKHSEIFLLLLLASSGFAADQPAGENVLSLSLNRAVQMAISPNGNAQIQISEESLKQAQARSSQTRAALLPDVSSSLAYRNQTLNLGANGLHFDIPTIPGFEFSFPALVGPFDVMDARISATQSVFDISSIRRLQAAHSGVSAAQVFDRSFVGK